MKIECLRDVLKTAVGQTERMIGKNFSLPILSGVLLTAKGNSLSLRATNLDLGVEISIPVKVEKEGTVILPAAILGGLLSGMYDKKITLEEKDKNIKISSQNNTSLIKCFPSEDFPTLPIVTGGESFTIPVEKFIDGIKSVSYAASLSDMKPEIASIYIYHENRGIVMVATDSFRLAEVKIFLKGIESFSHLLLPYKNALEISRVLESVGGDIQVSFNKNLISFSNPSFYITSRTIDGIFPDYRQIIPKTSSTEVIVLKQDLVNALKVTNVFSDKFNRVDLRVSVGQKLFSIEAKNEAVGENTTSIEAEISGEDIVSGFNQRYILDCLQSIKGDSICLKFSGVSRPMVVRGVVDESFLYLIMPLTV